MGPEPIPAVRFREKVGGTVSVVSMGPPPAVNAIKKRIEIGAGALILCE